MCAGCDLVFTVPDRPRPQSGLVESETHDEDGDGVPDAFDVCPHIAGPQTDFDGDGIGDDCDPHKLDPIDERYFVSFENGSIEGLQRDGIVAPEADSILLGSVANQHDGIVLPILTDTATIDVGFEMIGVAYEPPYNDSQPSFAEMAVAGAFRDYTGDNTQIGDTCFLGSDHNTEPDYLQFNEDNGYLGELGHRWNGPMTGVGGRFQLERTNTTFRCDVPRSGGASVGDGTTRTEPRAVTGGVAIWTSNVQVRLRYLWVVTPRPSPASP